MSKLPIFLLFAASLTPFVRAVAPCYKVNGSHNKTTELYTPCNQQTPFSMCFRTQVDSAGNPADAQCLPQGISQAVSPSGFQYWRQSCTDPTWESPYCLHSFDSCENDSNGNARVTPCGGEDSLKWCCGFNNKDCCDGPNAIVVAATLGVSSTSSTLSTTQTSTSSSTSSTSTSTTTPDPSPNKSGLSTGAVAGIAVVAALVGIAIICGIVLYALRRVRKSRRDSETPLQELGHGEQQPTHHLHEAPGSVGMEKIQGTYEAPGTEAYAPDAKRYRDVPNEPVEMPSDRLDR